MHPENYLFIYLFNLGFIKKSLFKKKCGDGQEFKLLFFSEEVIID